MTKTIKKILFVFITIISTFSLVNVYADETNGLYSGDLYRETLVESQNVYRDVVYSRILAETKTTMPHGKDQGLGGSVGIDTNKWYGQQINIVDVPRGQETFVIPWSIQGDMQWEFSSIAGIAYDFEAKHPGYKVLAGINADFYDWHTTLDYPNSGVGIEAHEGDLIRFVRYRDAVAIQNGDFTTDQLIYLNAGEMTRTATPVLTVYDENNEIIEKISLNKVNAEIADGEVGVLFGKITNVYAYDEKGNKILNSYGEHKIERRDYTAPEVVDGKLYFIGNAGKIITQAFNDGSGEFNFYAKGEITEVDPTNVNFTRRDFAIVSKNAEVNGLLDAGVTIRVQYDFTGAFEGQENVMGCYKSMIENGVLSEYHPDEYYRTRAPRTIIASKPDGTVGLITIDGRQGKANMYGANQEEMNTILQTYGYSNAFLLDGGGSSSFILRGDKGFKIVNSPSDGSIRSVSNGLFVVVKDEDYKVESISNTTDSITLKFNTEKVDFNKIKAIKVVLNNETKEVVNNEVTFTGLTKNTEYEYTVCHDTETQKNLSSTIKGTAHTSKVVPEIKDFELTYDDNNLYLKSNHVDVDSAISAISVEVNERRYTYYEDKGVTIPLSVFSDNLTYKITFRYNLNDYTSNNYISMENAIYKVEFDDGSGEILETRYVLENDTLAKPEDPSLDGKNFKGWYVDDKKFNFNTPITESLYLIANYENPSSNTGSSCSMMNVYHTITMISLLGLALVVLKRKQ